MTNHVAHIGIAVLTAAVAVGCSRPSHNSDSGARATTGSGRNNPAAGQVLKMDGCLQEGPSANGEFVLRQIVVPEEAAQPYSQPDQSAPIVRGSWVRLVGDTDELKGNLGKRVEVMGRVEDSGANTLGTSGRTTPAREADTDQEKFDPSSKDSHTNPQRNMTPTTVAPNGADANGMAPRVAVERVKALADACDAR